LTGQLEWDRQKRGGRTGQAEKDRQNWRCRTELEEQDCPARNGLQGHAAVTGLPGQDCPDRTVRTEDRAARTEDRAARTELSGQGCQDRNDRIRHGMKHGHTAW
jgi:hypothetical protein